MPSVMCSAALALLGCASPESLTLDRFGGLADVQLGPGPQFRLEAWNGRTWLVTPDGSPFFSAGVNAVRVSSDIVVDTGVSPYEQNVLARWGSPAAWADAVVERMHAWNLNTLGGWSDVDAFAGRMPYTVVLDLAAADWIAGTVADYFDPQWEAYVHERVGTEVAPRANDAWLVGYFLDNELRWTRDWRDTGRELIDDYLALVPGSPGRKAAVEFLRERYAGDVAAFNATWGTTLASFDVLLTDALQRNGGDEDSALADKRAFLRILAERYFAVTTSAVRAVDPAHLLLGTRVPVPIAAVEVLDAAAAHLDVVSVNDYQFLDGVAEAAESLFGPLAEPSLAAIAERVGKPLMVGEFGFRADDSGLPNSWPPQYPTFETQAERSAAFEAYVQYAFDNPAVVGVHVYKWQDQPAEGRRDGENNNWGLVDIHDDPYARYTEAVRTAFEGVMRRGLQTDRAQ
ncbi:MAG: hypothetical protein SFX73_34560 [Kofleriaceae bacterium]|nr:hypothetical protein [Kofleriaceae bacterium]